LIEKIIRENEELKRKVNDDSVNQILSTYSDLLGKIHSSVQGFGERIEDIEKSKAKRYKQLKRKYREKDHQFKALETHS